MTITHIDCTLRDGGYYNHWDFSDDLVAEYLGAMAATGVDVVEIGFRSFDRKGFRGACAYSTDDFLETLDLPPGVTLGVMVNGSELANHPAGPVGAAEKLFRPKRDSKVELVRIACHLHEIPVVLPACDFLASVGYRVGLNLMQVADRSDEELIRVCESVRPHRVEVLYFADSLGSMSPERTEAIVRTFAAHWKGPIGIHTHDNMGRAMANTLRAIEAGCTWVDSTVTGMGRGPGNAQTEYLAIELAARRGREPVLAPILALIRRHFGPLQAEHRWGTNPYYYLAGQFGIHPTYIQEMLGDPRYGEAEILSVIAHLKTGGGHKYVPANLEAGRQMYGGALEGAFTPASVLRGREVLILGAGPGVARHRAALERFIARERPYVLALNTKTQVADDLIDANAACHPFRLVSESDTYRSLPRPIFVPLSRLGETVRQSLLEANVRDFGLEVRANVFEFRDTSAVAPSSLAIAYALAIATSGGATRILLAGFDGFSADDPRTDEMQSILDLYREAPGAKPLLAVTPTRYRIPVTSIHSL